jgi:hypothetical protein
MKILRRILIGCLGLFILGIVAFVVVAGVMLSRGAPEQHRSQATQEQPITVPRLPGGVTPSPAEVPPPASSLRVELDLEEGRFDVRPGQPGSPVKVDADYDEGVYELVQETQATAGGGQTVRVEFHSRYSMLRRILTTGSADASKNHVTIYLPTDVPIDFHASISKGESDLDLTGVPLTGIDVELRMGQHMLALDQANPLRMEALHVSMKMGELRSRGLGNAHFAEAEFQGSMGQMGIDLRGDYTGDARVRARLTMGEVRMRIPAGVHVEMENRVVMGGTSGGRREKEELPPGAPTLRVDGSVTMGEMRVDRD